MAAASRCDMSTLRLQFVSTRGAFSYATFRACLLACRPVCLPPEINHTPAWPPKSKSAKNKKKAEKRKKRMKPKTKRAKCVMRYFLLIFSSSLLLVCGWLCVCARVSMSGCFRVRVKCAEWHIVFQSVGSADRWKHLMLAICICHLTPRQPTRRQRAQSPPRCLTTNTCDAFYWNYQWGQRSCHSPASCVKSLLTVLQVADVVEKDFL